MVLLDCFFLVHNADGRADDPFNDERFTMVPDRKKLMVDRKMRHSGSVWQLFQKFANRSPYTTI
eukprot:scaffold34596_cov222-Amphora_coffeaeformis.AAC.10